MPLFKSRPSKADFEREAMPHMPALYAAALRMTRNERDAEDLVQDAMLRAYRFFDTFEAGTNCKAWLFRILTNAFCNRYREREREAEILDRGGVLGGERRAVPRRVGGPGPRRRERAARSHDLRRRRAGAGGGAAGFPHGGDPRRPGRLLVQGDRRDHGLSRGDGHEPALSRPQDPAGTAAQVRRRAGDHPAGNRRQDAGEAPAAVDAQAGVEAPVDMAAYRRRRNGGEAS